MKLRRAYWQMITLIPRLHALNVLLQLFRNLFLLLPGLIVFWIFNVITANRPIGWDLWTLGALLVGAAVGRVTVVLCNIAVDATCVEYGNTLIRRNLFEKLLSRPGALALPYSPGELISRFTADTATITGALEFSNPVFGAAVQALVSVAIMLTINPLITLVVFVPLVGSSVLMNVMGARIQQYHRESRKTAGEVSAFIGEMFKTTHAIQLANAQQRVIAHLRTLNDARRKTKLRSLFFTDVVLNSVAINSSNIGTGVILLLAAQAMKSGTFTVGSLALFVSYIDEISIFLSLLSQNLVMHKQAGVALQRLQEALPAGTPEAALVAHAPMYLKGAYPPVAMPQRQAGPLEHLAVRGLTYRYEQAGKGIEEIAFQLKRGTCTVITGRIGAGKTTLLRTVLGLLPRQGGDIYWNGQRVAQPDRFFVPPQSAYTPQVPRLCSESLKENLLMGYPAGAERLTAAIYDAVMEEDVQALEAGLDTLVGPRGIKLSGGQIQRAAAARMFLRESDLLVFDDLSSALDVETEARLWERIFGQHEGQHEGQREGQRETTVLAVSHRRAVLSRANQIIVLREGRIEAIGPLDELLVSSAEMQRIWQSEQQG